MEPVWIRRRNGAHITTVWSFRVARKRFSLFSFSVRARSRASISTHSFPSACIRIINTSVFRFSIPSALPFIFKCVSICWTEGFSPSHSYSTIFHGSSFFPTILNSYEKKNVLLCTFRSSSANDECCPLNCRAYGVFVMWSEVCGVPVRMDFAYKNQRTRKYVLEANMLLPVVIVSLLKLLCPSHLYPNSMFSSQVRRGKKLHTHEIANVYKHTNTSALQ